MTELIVAQIVAILLPLLIFSVISFCLRTFVARPERFVFRMDLSLQLAAFPVFGLLFVWLKNPAGRMPEFEQLFTIIVSSLVFPALWCVQFMLDGYREKQADRAAQKARPLSFLENDSD
jgi:hypothetical protein